MVRMGKIVISVIATTGYNDEILSSPDRRYKRFLLYCKYVQFERAVIMHLFVIALIMHIQIGNVWSLRVGLSSCKAASYMEHIREYRCQCNKCDFLE